MHIEPYLMFNGRADEAIAFYRRAVGAELLGLLRVKDTPGPQPNPMMPPGSDDLVMHSALRIGDTTVMIGDGMGRGATDFRGITLSLTVADAAAADKFFTALGDGGKVNMPLGATFFSPCFGMLEDRFGVAWMVIVPGNFNLSK